MGDSPHKPDSPSGRGMGGLEEQLLQNAVRELKQVASTKGDGRLEQDAVDAFLDMPTQKRNSVLQALRAAPTSDATGWVLNAAGKRRRMQVPEESLQVFRVPADAPTIAAALALCTSGGKVCVRPGVYEEDVVIDKRNVILCPEPTDDEAAVVQLNAPVVVKSYEVTIRQMTVRCPSDALAVVDCRNVRVEECDLSSGRNGLLIRDCEDVVSEKNYLHECGKHGLAAFYSRNVKLLENFCSLNGGSGVVVGQCTGDVRANGLHQNGQHGIRVYRVDRDQLKVGENAFEENQEGEFSAVQA